MRCWMEVSSFLKREVKKRGSIAGVQSGQAGCKRKIIDNLRTTFMFQSTLVSRENVKEESSNPPPECLESRGNRQPPRPEATATPSRTIAPRARGGPPDRNSESRTRRRDAYSSGAQRLKFAPSCNLPSLRYDHNNGDVILLKAI